VSWICELERESILLMATLLYELLEREPEHEAAHFALDELKVQTEGLISPYLLRPHDPDADPDPNDAIGHWQNYLQASLFNE